MRMMRLASAGIVSVAAVATGAFVAPSAGAATCSVTQASTSGTTCTQSATVTGVVNAGSLLGVRTIQPILPVTLAAGTGVSPIDGVLAVTASEVNATGDSTWSVTAQGSSLTASGNTIPASAMTIADLTTPTGVGCLTLTLALGGCTVTGGGTTPRTLDSSRTLFTVTGENSTQSYTGLYAYTGTVGLNPPSGTTFGAYTGTITVTLNQ